MPTSFNIFKDSILEHIRYIIWNHTPKNYKILDVGPGIGFYGKHLKDLNIDAVELHQPYIDQFNLTSIYDNVYNENILNFDYDNYDYIIMGDILEHIPAEQAQKLIQDITQKQIKCLVAVPYVCPQDAVDGVEAEIHHQEDLTPRVMKSRYPELELLLTNNYLKGGYGYYTNYYKMKF